MSGCIEDSFLRDTNNHSMKIIQDDGVHRHMSFTDNGSSVYRFDLITWPGHLCISGDCGTYVFSRLHDMLEFFRMDKSDFNHSKNRKLNINAGYWGEKLQGTGTQEGYKRYSEEILKSTLLEITEDSWEFETDQEKEDVMQQLNDYVLDCFEGDESLDYNLASEFKSDHGHEFIDLFEYSFKEYTHHYIWCLYAIVYGIGIYDQSKQTKAA